MYRDEAEWSQVQMDLNIQTLAEGAVGGSDGIGLMGPVADY